MEIKSGLHAVGILKFLYLLGVFEMLGLCYGHSHKTDAMEEYCPFTVGKVDLANPQNASFLESKLKRLCEKVISPINYVQSRRGG